jgi:uncharacterized membrane protein
VFCHGKGHAAPGECFYFLRGHHKVGILIHLACILRKLQYTWIRRKQADHRLAAAILACLQFTPVIRHKALLFHRINGYVIILLVLISNAGVLMILRNAFGGGINNQGSMGLLVVVTTISLCMAWYNIKKLQVDQHRAWMLRAFFWVSFFM